MNVSTTKSIHPVLFSSLYEQTSLKQSNCKVWAVLLSMYPSIVCNTSRSSSHNFLPFSMFMQRSTGRIYIYIQNVTISKPFALKVNQINEIPTIQDDLVSVAKFLSSFKKINTNIYYLFILAVCTHFYYIIYLFIYFH